MIRFPVLDRLEVRGFALYPGKAVSNPGLEVTFERGLTLVVGANGLGKTTLVWILYRLLAGAQDIPGLDGGSDLGGKKLEPRPLRIPERDMFSQRVLDKAEGATARLDFRLGDRRVGVVRSLRNLALEQFTLDGVMVPADEIGFQRAIAELAGLWSFGDWLVMLRYLTFYFEDRRALVWDATAQRQVLRLLFLPITDAQAWTEAERRILELDSRVRNLGAALTREERALTEDEGLFEGAQDVREQIKALELLQAQEDRQRQALDQLSVDLEARRQTDRLAVLRAEQERESVFRELEHAKLAALEERFPSASDTARYLLAQLISEAECLACGSTVPEVAAMLHRRLEEAHCVVCDSDVSERAVAASRGVEPFAARRVARTVDDLARADDEVRGAKSQFEDSDRMFAQAQVELQALDTSVSKRRQLIDALIRRLPKEEAALHEQREELARLRVRVAKMKAELVALRQDFAAFMDRVRPSIVQQAPRVAEIFNFYAREFLVENCSLTWEQQKDRVGQTGMTIDFPTFFLDMTSAAYLSPVRRTGPEQVSESQREFIDLAFRMALMRAADPAGGGTLVIDAPESSLDAVFVGRAAGVLLKYAASAEGNRLVITSNLTDGELIPRLLADIDAAGRRDRTVDLFELAEPTAAVRVLAKEYRAVRERLLGVGSAGAPPADA